MPKSLTTPVPSSIEDWRISTGASQVRFRARRYAFGTVQGTFHRVYGVVRCDEGDPRYTHVDVQIPVASLTTGHWWRDGHILGRDLLDGASYQNIRFLGHWLGGDRGGEFSLAGELTLRGVSREVTLRVKPGNRDIDAAAGVETARYHATVAIDRRDFGLATPRLLRWSGAILGYRLHVVVDVTMSRSPQRSASDRLTAPTAQGLVRA